MVNKEHVNCTDYLHFTSVLGPILFTCYTKPLGAIARERGLSLHMYADDTQLYIAFKPVGGG